MKKVPIRCFLICLLSVGIFFTGCNKEIQIPEVVKALEGEEPEKARELTAKCVVRLDIRKDDAVYYGSALVWDVQGDNLILTTAGHLLEHGESIEICFPGNTGEKMTVYGEGAGDKDYSILQSSPGADIGFLEIPLSWLSDGVLKEIACVSLHQRIFNTIDGFSPLHLTASSEEGAGDILMDAVLVEKDRYQQELESEVMILQCGAQAGMSGGGIFDGYGHLVGMVIGGDGTQTAAISMERINEACEDVYGIRRDTEKYE